MSLLRRVFPVLPAVLLGSACGAATALPPQNAVTAVSACRQIGSDAQRLACFDQAAAALDVAVVHHDVTILNKEEVRQTRRSLFGFSMPNLALFGFGEKADNGRNQDMLVLDTTLRTVRSVSYGKWDLETEEDAVWRNVDLLDFAPTPGAKIHISKGTLGSFFLKIGSDRAVRAQRVR
jgi:hypothetical protein